MADAIEADVLDEEIPTGEADDQQGEQVEGDAPQGDEAEDELLVSFEGDGDAPPQSEERDTALVRHLREQLREKDRQLKAVQVQVQPATIEVGEKPTLVGCDYDEAQFEEQLDAWKERKAKAERQADEAQRSVQLQQDAWNKRLALVDAQKAKLGVKDYDQAAEDVRSTFNDQQQAMIVRATDNPAQMIYALGKNPAKAAELAKITDPVEFIAKVAKLEGKVSMQRRAPPPPEQIVRGSAPLSAPRDKELEGLEKEAERTGDRSKVVAYKRKLKAQAK